MSRAQMMNTIRLMVGSEIQNLVPETLTVDPVITSPRIWFNSTELAVKFGYLDTNDDPIVVGMGDTSEVEQTLTNYVNTKIAELGAAFSYRTTVNGGTDEASAFDLGTLYGGDTPRAGDYYKVDTSGWFTLGSVTSFANVGDGVLINALGGFDVIDNSNSEIGVDSGSVDFLAITGNPDVGYEVAVTEGFKTQFAGVLTQLTNIRQAAGLTAEGQIPTDAFTEYDHLNSVTSIIGALQALNGAIVAANEQASLDTTDLQMEVRTAFETLTTNLTDSFVAYESTAAAASHQVSHSFGTDVSVEYWIKDEDTGTYHNDQVSVSLGDGTVTLEATAAFNCKVYVRHQRTYINPMVEPT